MPPKLLKLFCRNSTECTRSEEKGGTPFKSSDSLRHHQKIYCLYSKSGEKKEMSEPKRGRGRPSSSNSDEITKVARLDSEGSETQLRIFEDNIKNTIAHLLNMKREGEYPANLQSFLKQQSTFFVKGIVCHLLYLCNAI